MSDRRAKRERRLKHPAMRTKAIVAAITISIAAIIILTYLDTQSNRTSQNPLSSIQLPGSSYTTIQQSGVTSNSTLNITFNIVNDESEGNNGYWALGNYTKHVYAVEVQDGNFNAIVTSYGTWRTVKGAPSPGNGTIEPANGSGTFTETYFAGIPGRLNYSRKLEGYVGAYNYNGTSLDLLSQSGPSYQNFNWPYLYFQTSGQYITLYKLNATFTYGNQTYAVTCNIANCTSKGNIIT